MLAPRADGPWQEGMPYRTHYWLRQLGAHPGIGMSTARLTQVAPERRRARWSKMPPALMPEESAPSAWTI